MLEMHLRKRGGDLDRRIHVAEGRREDQVVARLREIANHALGIRPFRDAFDVFGGDLSA
jgi:hypothetical protein